MPRGVLEFQADPASPTHKAELGGGRTLILDCASGNRSALAAKALQEMGLAPVVHAATLTAAPDQEHVVALGSVMVLTGRLPLAQAQALLLVGAEGYTSEEAALRIGCQVGTVKSRVSRARAFLIANLTPGLPGLGLAGL